MKRKVFCIGWHKTGTTTLGEALLILGYDVVGARLDFAEELLAGNFTGVISEAKHYQAFQDIPWAALYKELDEAFPRSKFILTVRDESNWLQSAKGHFADKHYKLHQWLYGNGVLDGNESLYLERFNRHYKQVEEYFVNRENDLLVFDVFNGDGWSKLCTFLEHPEPRSKFPFANKRKSKYNKVEKVKHWIRSIVPAPIRRGIYATFGIKDRRNRFNNIQNRMT